ncbi:tetratricopeptide repeat protein [Kaistella flava (ex Peng et al. 2021)]|uniref:Tetratricopeptide repeat protein n=1 Tax=Kaistella flava (ex Peng et al. 2021) TaxID=2038776 RepID=A0A7M2YDM0_9FLAO|nr:tetratricopeptide repeat protein [Kaistella flava (ex Peng et al. 2021)]
MNYFDKSLQQYPNFSDAQFYKAQTYYFLNDKKKGIKTVYKIFR